MIAIQPKKYSFSDRWIAYCEQNKIPYKLVNCYASDIMQQLEGCDALMWHFHHASSRDVLFAKQLLYAVAASGIKVFPDYYTCWHFDDKVGQKYLLEAIKAPMVATDVFYSKITALEWAQQTVFPKVFKLRGGAGSTSVKLIKDSAKFTQLANRAFYKGFKHNSLFSVPDIVDKFKRGNATFLELCKSIARSLIKTPYEKVAGRENGYLLVQDFIPYNDFDIRVIVIDGKAFAIKRLVRKGDFRASGSGMIEYSKELFNENTIHLSFEMARQLKMQCVAFDYVYEKCAPLIVEISYGFSVHGYDPCPGYWTEDLIWHEGPFNPQSWMVELMLK